MKTQKSDSNLFLILKKYGIAVLVMGAAILFYACDSNEIAKIQAFDELENLPVLEASNFKTFYTDSGQVEFTLTAPKLLRYENDGKTYLEFPEGMQLIKYDSQKRIISSITADYAKQFLKEERWEAKNNVVVTNAQGDSLKTEHLIWEEKEEMIHTEEFVKIIRDDQIITGIGLTSDQDMVNWKIRDPKGVIYVSASKNPNPGNETETGRIQTPAAPPEIPPPPADSGKKLQFK